MYVFLHWEKRVERTGGDPLIRPGFMKNPPLFGGVIMFFFQYLLQGGYFFIVPLFLSVVLELNALETGIRLVPLSITVILAALGIPKLWPTISPRFVVRIGVLLMLAGARHPARWRGSRRHAHRGRSPDAAHGPGNRLPRIAAGQRDRLVGIRDEETGEVGGLQNTFSNLGISVGTAVAGSI